jgi:hypothetical protein
MVSWVVLSATHVELTVDSLLETLDALYPGQFLPPGDRNFVIEGPIPPAQFLIQSTVPGAAGTFMLNTVAGSYSEFSDFADHIDEPSLRALALAQAYWMSVDLVGRHKTDEDAYRFIGSLLARIAPADSAVLVHPSKATVIRFDEAVRRRLADGLTP